MPDVDRITEPDSYSSELEINHLPQGADIAPLSVTSLLAQSSRIDSLVEIAPSSEDEDRNDSSNDMECGDPAVLEELEQKTHEPGVITKDLVGGGFSSAERVCCAADQAVSNCCKPGSGMTLPPLATVLENVPLVYSGSSTLKGVNKSSDDSTVNYQPGSADAHQNSPCNGATIDSEITSNAKTVVEHSIPFKGHARHSSYDTGPSFLLKTQLDATVSIGTGSPCHLSDEESTGIERARSLCFNDVSKAGTAVDSCYCEESTTSSFSVSSLSLYSDSRTSVSNEDGDGQSKKGSSLDRRSLASYDSFASGSFTGSEGSSNLDAAGKRRLKTLLPRSLVSWIQGNNKAQPHHCGVRSDVSSTTALILQNRPEGLPAKSSEEEQRHRQQYEQMLEAARKKEQKEAKRRQKRSEEEKRKEDVRAAIIQEWTDQILPNWDSMKSTKRVQELWWDGLPPNVRGKVWMLAIANELNITTELYEICFNRAVEKLNFFHSADKSQRGETEQNAISRSSNCNPHKEGTSTKIASSQSTLRMQNIDNILGMDLDKEQTLELIHLDVSRTFPQLGIFQQGGPYYDLLLNLLGAYVCYRPDVGYVQGMSFLAAVLLLNLDSADAFVAFANLMNRPCQIAFFHLKEEKMRQYFSAYEDYFRDQLPSLFAHFAMLQISPDLYLIDWLYTLYAKSLPLDVACRVWDVFLRDGEDFLFKTALGLLQHFEEILLKLDFDHVCSLLTKIPDSLTPQELFSSIERLKSRTCSSSTPGKLSPKRKFSGFLNDVISQSQVHFQSPQTPSGMRHSQSQPIGLMAQGTKAEKTSPTPSIHSYNPPSVLR